MFLHVLAILVDTKVCLNFVAALARCGAICLILVFRLVTAVFSVA